MDAIHRARDLVPVWADLAAVGLHVGLAGGVAWVLAALLALAGRRRLARLAGAPWPERARVAFPYRYALSAFAAGAVLAVAYLTASTRGPLAWSPVTLAVLAAAAAYLGATHARLGLERGLGRRAIGLGAWLVSLVTLWTLFFPHVFVAGVMALLVPARGPWLWIGGGLGLAAMLALAAGGGVLAGRALRLLLPPSSRLARVVAAEAERAGVRVKGVYEARHLDANALALPHSGHLAFTTRALEALDDAQLAALTQHELAHLAEPRGVRIARLGGLLVLLPFAFARFLLVHGGLAAFGLALLAAVLLAFLLKRMARRMEERADAAAHGVEAEPGAYARALEALYRANLTPAVMPGRRGVHPHLYDRLVAAGATPAYERPAAPGTVRARLGFVAALLVLALASALWPLPLRALDAEPAQWLALAAQGRSRTQAARVAELLRGRGRGADAATLYAAAATMNPRSPRWPAHQADVLLELGRLDEAEAALREAADRARRYGRPNPLIESVSYRLAVARGR